MSIGPAYVRQRPDDSRRSRVQCSVIDQRVQRMRCTGGPRGTPRIDGERAVPAQKENHMYIGGILGTILVIALIVYFVRRV
jgi:hypothetical protein